MYWLDPYPKLSREDCQKDSTHSLVYSFGFRVHLFFCTNHGPWITWPNAVYQLERLTFLDVESDSVAKQPFSCQAPGGLEYHHAHHLPLVAGATTLMISVSCPCPINGTVKVDANRKTIYEFMVPLAMLFPRGHFFYDVQADCRDFQSISSKLFCLVNTYPTSNQANQRLTSVQIHTSMVASLFWVRLAFGFIWVY